MQEPVLVLALYLALDAYVASALHEQWLICSVWHRSPARISTPALPTRPLLLVSQNTILCPGKVVRDCGIMKVFDSLRAVLRPAKHVTGLFYEDLERCSNI